MYLLSYVFFHENLWKEYNGASEKTNDLLLMYFLLCILLISGMEKIRYGLSDTQGPITYVFHFLNHWQSEPAAGGTAGDLLMYFI